MEKAKQEKGIGVGFILLLIFLAIPTIAFVASFGIEWKLDSMLKQAVREDYSNEEIDISKITVSSICSDYELRSELNEVCELNGNVALMKFGAILSALIGIALIIGIKISGQLARGNRKMLLLLFKPLLHVTMLTLSGLMIAHAALGMAAIFFGESILIGTVHIGIMLALGIGALFGILAMIHAQFSTFKIASTTVIGKRIDPRDHPRLWTFVRDLANQMEAEIPNAIVAGLEPNFYVTEANVVCIDGKLKGRTMYISVPLCRILSIDETKAVLAHELAHYKGFDTKFSKKFYPIYRGLAQGITNISSGFSQKEEGSASAIILLPALLSLTYFLAAFSEAENTISREREIAADKEAALVESPNSIASALVKIHAFSDAWFLIKKSIRDALSSGKQLINASTLFMKIIQDMKNNKALEHVSEEGPIHPTDSHPPLSLRLDKLNLTYEQVIEDASNTSPKDPSVDLFESAEELEEELTEIEHLIMLKRGEAQLGNSQANTGGSAS